MKKRIISILLAVLALVSLAACTGSNDPATTPDDPAEVDHIIVTYLTLGTTPADLQKVQDAVNEMTIDEINVEVEFKPVSAYDAFSLFPTWLATGERVDLMIPLLQDLRSYVDQGLIEPLDDLIAENAPNLSAMIAEGQPIISNNYIDGSAYAINSVPNVWGQGGGFIIAQKYLDEVEWEYDADKIYSLDDLTELFAQIKELHPEMYPCGVVTTGKTSSEFAYSSGIVDTIAGSPSCTGVLLGEDSTTVVDLFETEEYKSYLEHRREWYLAGYIHPDAATMEGTVDSLKAADVSAGYFMVSAPIQRKEGDCIIRLSKPYQPSGGAGGWTVPITAEEPEAAIRFIDMVWSNSELANLIQFGIEGDHWVMIDKSINYIGFPEGVTATDSGYFNSLGVWGDCREIYTMTSTNTQADNDAYTAEAEQNQSNGIGIAYNNSAMINEITALSVVAAQYIPALESGSVDIDTYYPEFIAALKAAGIDAVVADKQAQFDAQYNG